MAITLIWTDELISEFIKEVDSMMVDISTLEQNLKKTELLDDHHAENIRMVKKGLINLRVAFRSYMG